MSFLSDNLLTCRPPYDEPKLAHDDHDPFCADFNSVLVRNYSISLMSAEVAVQNDMADSVMTEALFTAYEVN